MIRSQQYCSSFNNRVFTFFSIRHYSKNQSRNEALETLGLGKEASKSEIKNAYLKLSKSLHPDINKSSNATEEFQKVKSAFDMLSSDSSSKSVDQQEVNEKAYRSMSEEYQDYQRRLNRTRQVDEYFRRVQRESFKRRNNESTFNYDGEPEPRKVNEKLDENYIQFEKTFISYLEYFLIFGKVDHQETRNIPTHSSYILRKLIQISSLFLIIFILGSGVEIYHEMNFDKPEDARPEYVESLKPKSGTLDDL